MAESVIDLKRAILAVQSENKAIRHAASALWDGVTDILTQAQIDKIERLYREELTLLFGDGTRTDHEIGGYYEQTW